ncbi:Zinc finger, RING/FYVE/PHD-type [Corchorus olitorius]|uniref:Zinc finger, RING/FYVE/PHD-type n=1 Tax=Corchorus olitorius TaxID=93759 RepID=A0A1R3GBI4_9ROSI|nr:Zinc finger, RING/FYVE/PHD-type [Corchorus olitorius]
MSSQEEGEIVSSSDDDDSHSFEVLSNAQQIDVLESQEEAEIVPDDNNNNISVSEYVIFEQNGKRISFADLPLQWRDDHNEAATTGGDGSLKTNVFVYGFSEDNGVKQRIYEQVIAWKFDLSPLQPVIMVLTKEKKRWLRLRNPKRVFMSIIKTILVTLYWMHFLKRFNKDPQASSKFVWSYLHNIVFSSFEFKASVKDLLCHKLLIAETMKRDEDFAKFQDVLKILEEMPQTYTTLDQDLHSPTMKGFIVDEDPEEDYYEDDNDIGEEIDVAGKSIFDIVCAFCDRGGNVLCCDGRCLRSFHPTKEDEIHFFCGSLGLDSAEVDDILSFLCTNCTYKQHQCYACGELGSSDVCQEVFPCVSATCGHFYHPKCAAKLLHPDNEAEATTLEVKVAAGHSFICPMHKCFACKEIEDSEVQDLQFAVCRRYPKRNLLRKPYEGRSFAKGMERSLATQPDSNILHVRKKVERRRHSVNDADLNDRMLAIMESVYSSFNTEEFMKKHQQFSTANSRILKGTAVRKSITVGRVEASAKAARTASEKLQAGDSLEDAKAVCGPDVLNQMSDWKKDLSVYLGPFLYGPRYTSYGRHYTKVEKLKEIVNRLYWYLQDGDTIVDFCCGSNDFSCLLNEKLEEVRKSCSFKNYDLFHPKNDFNFEQKDWMTVNIDELPDGSELVIGLNPPVGREASGTNKFIQKALRFRPKLIVVIAPMEARRRELEAYDLIWEDHTVLSGKSFYLPNSVDIDNKPLERYNVEPPGLYLWSRHDWTTTHKAIAQENDRFYVRFTSSIDRIASSIRSGSDNNTSNNLFTM